MVNYSKLTILAHHLIHISTALIAVSGATGFLGAHVVCQLLKEGLPVRAFRRNDSDLTEFNLIYSHYFSGSTSLPSGLEWVEVDILDIPSLDQALTNVKVVYHCAAMVSFDPKDKTEQFETNVTGTSNLVNASLANGVEVFCHTSSVAALGRRSSGEWIDESAVWEESPLNSNYAISKHRAEMEAWRGMEEGLKVAVVNPTILLGIGNVHKGSNALIGAVKKGLPFYTKGINGYVDVADVAKIMITLVQQKIFGKRFVLVSENLSNQSLFNQIAEVFGVKKPTIEITPWRAEIGWRLFWIKRLFNKKGIGITKETARSSLNISYYSNKSITSSLNFVFKTIHQTLEDCKQFESTQH